MNIIRVSDEELRLLRSAMQMYLRSFGHNEADTLERVRSVLHKLADATREDDPADLTG
jgi:hypothetical protein